MYTLLLLVLLVGCVYFLCWSQSWRANRYLGHLPTFPKLPVLGSIHFLFGGGIVAFRCLVQATKVSEERNQPFVIWVGPYPALILHDPEEMKIVSNTFVEKPSYYDLGKVWLGDGLVLAPGNIWKQNIKKIGGTFTRGVVNGYQNIFNAQAKKLVEKLRTELDRPPFKIRNYISYTTLETICKTGLGVSRITDDVVTEEYHKAFDRAAELIVRRGLNVFYHPDCIFQRTTVYKELMKCLDVVHSVSTTVIKKRKREREVLKSNKSLDKGNFGSQTNFKAFLDILLDLSETDSSLTDKQIRAEVDTIIFGGQESVASALCFILHIIGNKPDVQNKLYAEIIEVVGNNVHEIAKDELSRMVYCEAVILETLRLYPSFPIVMRCAENDIKLNSCTIPKGTTCLLNIWGAGRSQRLWGSDAEEFIPERWLPPRVPCVSAWLPFSIGKRACIGKIYAIALLKTILAQCVREFLFTSADHDMTFKLDLVLRPETDYLIQVKLRNNKLL